MKKIYYLFSFVFVFLGIQLGFAQPACSTIEIVTVENGSVCGGGSVTLEATASGTGTDIYWYDAATGGNYLGKGSNYTTPEISATTSYWATEVITTGGMDFIGETDPASVGTISASSLTNHGMNFTVTNQITLQTVDIFPTAAVGSAGTIEIREGSAAQSGNIVATIPFTTTVSGTTAAPVADNININAVLTPGDYNISMGVGVNILRNTTGASYPYTKTDVEITGNTFNTAYWYYFYNWEYATGVVLCESTRVEAVATVNNVADEDIASLPYTHPANTATYHNNYSGTPGANCGSDEDYLYGSDVVYKYTADDDYILTIELSNLSDSFTGVFVYESCADIGTACAVEGSVSEASTANHGFQMAVENGKDYYFVVSSAEPTDSFNYTLNIDGFTCANYPAPTGAATQDFVDGQKLHDLDAQGLELTWYSDAALTNVLPKDTELVDNTTYYVTQTFDTCESSALAITVSETSCTVLDVVASQGAAVCGEGSVTLTAEGAKALAGTEIFWYDRPTGGEVVGQGNEFVTGVLEETTSFWAAEVVTSTTTPTNALASYCVPSSGSSGCNVNDYINDFILEDANGNKLIEHLGSGCSSNAYDNQTANPNYTATLIAGETYDFSATFGTSSQYLRIWIDFDGNGSFEDPGEFVFHSNTAGSTTVATIGSFEVPEDAPAMNTVMRVRTTYSTGDANSCTQTSSYGEVHDYKVVIIGQDVLCASDRVEVVAEVNEVADEIVTEPLPYVHTASTGDYGNNYFGLPGANCISEDYLDGHDVVYKFSPSVGAVYKIELSGLSSNNAGVFVYESCFDIGIECLGGAVSDGTTNDFAIDEIALNDGQDYYIVISTKTSSQTDYTITITEAVVNCNDYTDAPEGDDVIMTDIGSTLDDLKAKVKGANLTWYADSNLSTVLPGTTPVVDGTTYYVTQTLNGCESDALEFTVYEIDCSVLEIVSVQDGTIVCKGTTILEATGSGAVGTEIFWYESETATKHIHAGSTFETPQLTSTKSYWVAEVATSVQTPTNALASYCMPSMGSSGCNLSDHINDFILEDDKGNKLIEHLGSGCSTGAYDDLTGNPNYTATLQAGETYDFSATFGSSSQYLRIWIDFNGNGSFEDAGELVYVSNAAGSTTIPTLGSFEIPADAPNINTVMRVRTTWSTGAADSCTQTGSYGEVHDYKVVIMNQDVLCESPRVEVIAEVTQDGNEVVGTLPYSHSQNTATYGNTYSGTPGANCGVDTEYLNGNDVVYMFTATEDDMITIELTDISEYYAGMFIYEACGDIGDDCLAGAVAGPSTDDVVIQDFPVEDGKTYYIVVSSWLTDNFDYTLNINSFSCAELEVPAGEDTQIFVGGDMLDELEVETTRPGAFLTWYEDAALTNEIADPSTHALVDGDVYYVTQTTNDCESDALAVTAVELDCTNLGIVSTTDASISCRGVMTLKATATGTGSEIYWYDAATGGEVVGKGPNFTTPELTQTTSYWVSEAYIADYTLLEDQAESNPPALLNSVTNNGGLQFEVYQAFTLEDVTVLGTGNGGDIQVDIRDINNGNNIIFSTTATVPAGGSTANPMPVLIPIDFELQPGNYRILRSTPSGSTAGLAYMSALNSSFPYTIGANLGQITTGSLLSGTSTLYYFFYNWTVRIGDVTCESPREEVVATVIQDGDYQLDYTDLPYTDTNNTANSGNHFSGQAGDGCLEGNYLNGYEALYFYQADPNNDDIITIELSNASNPGAAVFVYESCGDIGISCLAGTTLDGGVAKIEDLYVDAGTELMIVVTSMSGTMNYDLDIYGIDCNDVLAPTGNPTPYFVAGDMVSDLKVDGSIFNDGFKWYSDANLTNEILDPTTEAVVDGDSYFVTQTILGCEGLALEIMPIEFECTAMGVEGPQSQLYVCAPGGDITLKTTSSGLGSEIFWYDAATEGNYLGRGTEMSVFVDQTTSVYAEEVYIDGGVFYDKQADTNPTSLLNTTSSNAGLLFEVHQPFTLESVTVNGTGTGGQIQVDIRHVESNNDVVFSTMASIPAGGTTASPNPVVIPIEVDLQPGTYRILRVTSGTTVGLGYKSSLNSSFPYTLGNNLGEVISGSLLSSTSTLYYYFYDWTISTGEIVCKSSREEFNIILNEDIPNAPVVTPLQLICGDALLSDFIVLGENIKWYASNGIELNPNSPVVEGQSYYVTQTVNGCESYPQEIIMEFNEKSELPVAAVNQAFEMGETLADLVVHGDNLRWYRDQFKTLELPSTTKLVDQTTYYVSQVQADKCEGDALGITVHEFLDVKDQLFEYFDFYPNPVVDILTITNSDTIEQIEIFDLTGRKVFEQDYKETELSINIENFATGTYLLRAKVDGFDKVFRIVKK